MSPLFDTLRFAAFTASLKSYPVKFLSMSFGAFYSSSLDFRGSILGQYLEVVTFQQTWLHQTFDMHRRWASNLPGWASCGGVQDLGCWRDLLLRHPLSKDVAGVESASVVV